jgi:hypothetical protein
MRVSWIGDARNSDRSGGPSSSSVVDAEELGGGSRPVGNAFNGSPRKGSSSSSVVDADELDDCLHGECFCCTGEEPSGDFLRRNIGGLISPRVMGARSVGSVVLGVDVALWMGNSSSLRRFAGGFPIMESSDVMM